MSLKHALRFSFALGTLAALPFTLSACGSVGEDGAVVDNQPPVAEVEYIPYIADPRTEIWRPGYWTMLVGGGYSWVPGKVISRPSPTASWAPAHWVRHTYGWSFEQGHWQ